MRSASDVAELAVASVSDVAELAVASTVRHQAVAALLLAQVSSVTRAAAAAAAVAHFDSMQGIVSLG